MDAVVRDVQLWLVSSIKDNAPILVLRLVLVVSWSPSFPTVREPVVVHPSWKSLSSRMWLITLKLIEAVKPSFLRTHPRATWFDLLREVS